MLRRSCFCRAGELAVSLVFGSIGFSESLAETRLEGSAFPDAVKELSQDGPISPESHGALLWILEGAFSLDQPEPVQKLIEKGLPADFEFPGSFPAWGVAERYGARKVMSTLAAAGWPEDARVPLNLGEAHQSLPSVIRLPAFALPSAHLATESDGELRFDLILDRDGKVRFPLVLEAPSPKIATIALFHVSEMRFRSPALESGEQGVRWVVPVVFSDAEPVRAANFYEIVSLEHPPRPVKRVPPRFPEAAVDARLTGDVVVEFVIRADGSVDMDEIKVVSATHDIFIEPTIEALKDWRFEPGRVHDRAVATRVRQRIPFQLMN